MNAERLLQEQKRIDALIDQVGEAHGLSKENIWPIRDGIADEEGYLQSKPRVAWILKEPYDDYDSTGKPCGGGWSLVKDCFSKNNAWKNPIWQKIAYVMYGFKHNLQWKDIPWIRDCHQIIDEIRTVAWINLSKMPAYTYSNIGIVANNFRQHWETVVQEQLRVYNPEVIIFGYTFGCMRNLFPNAEKIERYSNQWVALWRYGNQILLDTYHPGRKGEGYVNALIDALYVALQELGK